MALSQWIAGLTAKANTLVLCCCLQCVSYMNWDRRLMMLHDVAAGMCYLHGRQHIHGDLRSPNLFVGADGMVRPDTGLQCTGC